MNYLELYKNSVIHFAKTKNIMVGDTPTDIHLTLIDRRFLSYLANEGTISKIVPYCKVKYLDEYWVGIYHSHFINNQYLFNNLMNNRLIVDIPEFIKIIEGRT